MRFFFFGYRRITWLYLLCLSVFFSLPTTCSYAGGWVTARHIADGDTIILDDGRHIRYIGIDAPEIDHKRHTAAPMGYEARSLNRLLVKGWRLKLVTGKEARDHYGRTLAYVYREDGVFVNEELVKKGCAYVYYRSPNINQFETLLSAQKEAMKEGRGLWRLIDKNETPSSAYLGNLRSKRFHAFNCPNGKKISKKNQVRLKNQWEAFWAGFSPDRNCIHFP